MQFFPSKLLIYFVQNYMLTVYSLYLRKKFYSANNNARMARYNRKLGLLLKTVHLTLRI